MIDIPRLLPIVRQAFPNAPLPVILQQMMAFAKKHPNLTNEQAIQAFQAGLQQSKQKKPLFQGLVGKATTGAK